MRRILSVLIISFFCFNMATGQGGETRMMAPYNPEESDRPILSMFTGEQWKTIWQIPIEVSVVEESSLKSGKLVQKYKSPVFGAVPLKAEFIAFYTPLTPESEENYQEFVSELAADPLTTRFPYSVSVMERLTRALGFQYPETYPVALRDSTGKDKMGYLLISPKSHEEIITTAELVNKRNLTSIDSIDYRAYLKLRLLDILVNNWEKDPQLARWQNINGIWQPLPGYYKKAFSRFEGILPDAFTTIAPQWNSFEKKYPGIEGLTWNRRQIDRQMLSSIGHDEWQIIVKDVISSLSTSVILEGIDYLPAVFRYNTGVEIFEIINVRKTKLADIAEDYYNYINASAELYGTGGTDSLYVKRKGNITHVKLVTKSSTITKNFEYPLTQELRIYLADGEDFTEVDCSYDNDMAVRVIGEKGVDEYRDTCPEKNRFTVLTLFGVNRFNNFFYDDENSLISLGKVSKFYNKSPGQPQLKMELLFPSARTRGSGFGISPVASFSRDDGFVLGIEPMFTSYAFAKYPYDYRFRATFQYSTKSGGYILGLKSIFYSMIEDAAVMFDIRKTESIISKYYGYGNDVSYSETRHDNGGYDLAQETFHLLGEIDLKLNKNLTLAFGGSYNFSDSKPDSADLLATFPGNHPGTGAFTYFKLFSRFVIDTRDNDFYPRKGLFAQFYFAGVPQSLDNKELFWKGEFCADFYKTYYLLSEMTTNLRIGGGKLWNNYPFFESVLIGGEETLPGFRDYRFAGDASFYSILSQNIVLSNIRFLVKGKLGAKLLITSGRVFSQGDLSDTWHYAVGGGFWFNGFNETIYGEVTAAQSDETTSIYITTSFKM